MDVSTFGANGATNPAQNIGTRTRVADTSSRITFAANEDLGGGLNAGIYCETGINVDNASYTGQADTTNSNTTTLCSREGRLYIGNELVQLRLGRQNVWWTQGQLNQVGANYLGADTLTNLINGGVNVYTVRGENQVKLVAGPSLGAFANSELYMGMMGRTGMDSTTVNSTGESSVLHNGKYHGFKLNYDQGPIVGMIDYQASSHSPFTDPEVPIDGALNPSAAQIATFNTTSYKRNAIKFGAGYRYGSGESLASFQYWKKSRTSEAAGAVENKDGGYGVVINHDLGAGYVLVAQYGKANKRSYGDNTAQTENGATGYTLGGLKRLSKRTHLYTAYHVINNGSAGTYNMVGGNYASSAVVGAGSTVKMFALGFQHNF